MKLPVEIYGILIIQLRILILISFTIAIYKTYTYAYEAVSQNYSLLTTLWNIFRASKILAI